MTPLWYIVLIPTQTNQREVTLGLSDIDLINISQFFISIMMTVVFLLAWKIIERKTYAVMWALFYFVSAINGVFNALNNLFPDRNLYWVVVNAMSLLSQALALAGYRMRAGKTAYTPAILAYFITVECLVIYFTYFQPHMGLRMVFVPYSGALVVIMIAVEIGCIDRPVRLAEKSAVVLFLLYGLVQILSGTFALLQGEFRDEHYINLYFQSNFLFMPAFYAGLGFFTLLILVEDMATTVKRQAITDYLTKLLNRRGFKQKADRLIQQMQGQSPLAVIVADIDHFKRINDQHGHQIGDEVLQTVSNWMRKLLPTTAVMGRTGGEEFAVVLAVKSLKEAHQLAEHLREQLSTQSHNTNPELHITGSFGVALIENNLEQALRQADQAMYQSKTQGRDQVTVFTG